MLCFSVSEQEIEIALDNAKVAFCNSTAVADAPANLEQCVKALKIAVDRLTKIKKDGKHALNKDQNLNLKKAVEEAYMELTQLQVYFGPDKAQKCFQVAGKWRGVVYIPEPNQPQRQPQLQPPVHESRRYVDSASISSGGTHSIPDRFYQADSASISGEIDIHGEENPARNIPGSSKVDVDVLGVDETNEDQARPREQYVKHAGCFADAAPRMEHSTGDVDEGLLGTTSTSGEGNREDPAKDGMLNPETSGAASAAPPQETPSTPTSENKILERRNILANAVARASHDFVVHRSAAELLTGGALPSAGQGQLAGPQANALSQQHYVYYTPTLDGSVEGPPASMASLAPGQAQQWQYLLPTPHQQQNLVLPTPIQHSSYEMQQQESLLAAARQQYPYQMQQQ